MRGMYSASVHIVHRSNMIWADQHPVPRATKTKAKLTAEPELDPTP